jgi:hypothetical protein
MGKCQESLEENVRTYYGMGGNCQGGQEGKDEELVIFSEEGRASDDCKRMKLMKRYQMVELLNM